MGFIHGNSRETVLDGSGVELVDVFLLVFGVELGDHWLYGVLLGVGVVAGEHQTGGALHGQFVLVGVGGGLREGECEEGQ